MTVERLQRDFFLQGGGSQLLQYSKTDRTYTYNAFRTCPLLLLVLFFCSELSFFQTLSSKTSKQQLYSVKNQATTLLSKTGIIWWAFHFLYMCVQMCMWVEARVNVSVLLNCSTQSSQSLLWWSQLHLKPYCWHSSFLKIIWWCKKGTILNFSPIELQFTNLWNLVSSFCVLAICIQSISCSYHFPWVGHFH